MDLTLFHSNAAESFAQANGVLEAAVAWLLWRQVHVRKEWALDWLALSMLCAAVINIGTPILVTPNIGRPSAVSVSLAIQIVVGYASLASMVAGLVAYCEYSRRPPLHLFLFLWVSLPVLTVAAWGAGLRSFGDWLALALFAYLAWMVWNTGRRFAGVGHTTLAAALLGYPLSMFLLQAFDMAPEHIRYLASSPYTLIGVVLLSVTLNRQTQERDRARSALAALNAELEQRVLERTLELEHNVEQLKRAQKQLVQSEKLAALGSLVAGVAHELNTPLGNVRVAASALLERALAVQGANAAGQLRRSQLEDFLNEAGQMSALIDRGSQRAAELVATFKRVSVDQSSMQRRTFRLAQVVQDTHQVMLPSLKRLPLGWALDVPVSLELDSYPGAVEQVLSNLFQNAAVHGLGDRTSLQLHVCARPQDRDFPGVLLEVSDDGVGMPSDVAQRAFDPYFSTRFGQGGSGLGLYIVHGLVTGALGGEITLTTQPGQGARFSLWLPLQAPHVTPQ
ncbi:HAMP domain-containing sensor histidine kinase [Curvibacter sp. APW13]|uniref:sensor histidine kinase n=1 Tax=Curvibacter sp. APW13 TaxID=3077236 RepID=UPI0028DFA599|nr:HAMP domain-containing sensor histidine kinase [Curvibacter sp. APW13]MDT8991828.1 HAMP domain-containing sensor histidine kinase [Curvibacter sp. APW13]